MHSEKMPFHRDAKPVAELRLNGYEAKTKRPRHGIGTVYDRYIEGIMPPESELPAEVGHRCGQVGHIRLDRPPVTGCNRARRFYGLRLNTCRLYRRGIQRNDRLGLRLGFLRRSRNSLRQCIGLRSRGGTRSDKSIGIGRRNRGIRRLRAFRYRRKRLASG